MLKLWSDTGEIRIEANEKWLEAVGQMKAVDIEKRKLKEKQRKEKSELKGPTRKQELYSEKQDHLKNERFMLES